MPKRRVGRPELSPEERRDRRVLVRLKRETYAALQKRAKREGLPLATTVEKILKRSLRREKKGQKL